MCRKAEALTGFDPLTRLDAKLIPLPLLSHRRLTYAGKMCPSARTRRSGLSSRLPALAIRFGPFTRFDAKLRPLSQAQSPDPVSGKMRPTLTNAPRAIGGCGVLASHIRDLAGVSARKQDHAQRRAGHQVDVVERARGSATPAGIAEV